jgi:short-chain fatty acids transporter
MFLAAVAGQDPDMGQSPGIATLLRVWESSLWNRQGMVFTGQMLLILVLGHVLALTPFAAVLLERSLRLCRNSASAAATVALTAMLAAWVNWGLGLIIGAVLARKAGEKARREGWPLHYPLVGAAGYVGMMVWHGGLSGSAPLAVNTPDHSLINVVGVIPLAHTLGSWTNLAACAALLVFMPLLFFVLGKRLSPSAVPLPQAVSVGPVPGEGALCPKQLSFAISGRIGTILFSMLLLAAVALRFLESDGKSELRFLTLDFINLSLLGFGLLLHGSFSRYAQAAEAAMPAAAGIAIQFPFYFGIMGLMQQFGLVSWMAAGFVALSTAESFPVLGLLSAGLVNFFVPSGGGQWQVQGPVLVEAARSLGVADWKAIMALAYGDQLTNMLQPFWALPLLGITGLTARDILPYTAVAMLLGLVIFALALTLF